MKKSILLLGPLCSGKTFRMREILSETSTDFVLDGALSVDEVISFNLKALKAKSFCIITSLLNPEDFSETELSNFNVIICERFIL